MSVRVVELLVVIVDNKLLMTVRVVVRLLLLMIELLICVRLSNVVRLDRLEVRQTVELLLIRLIAEILYKSLFGRTFEAVLLRRRFELLIENNGYLAWEIRPRVVFSEIILDLLTGFSRL